LSETGRNLEKRLLATGLLARVEHHPSLGSTNDRARVLAADHQAQLPILVVAEEQTAGRGRGENRWWTGSDSLACSLLLDRESVGLERRLTPQLSLAAAVAVIDAVEEASRKSPADLQGLGLHWPNDVFLRGGKLAGILVEGIGARRCILGIGVNTNNSLANAPPELRAVAMTLRDAMGDRIDQAEFLATLVERLWANIRLLTKAPDGLADRYAALCLQQGHTLTIQVAGRRATGRCLGIKPDGALELEIDGRIETFYGGVLVR
jgi:BirA family biotin operon repressor/biotin-[acetyl-CoA-carboxylase] ligase